MKQDKQNFNSSEGEARSLQEHSELDGHDTVPIIPIIYVKDKATRERLYKECSGNSTEARSAGADLASK